MSGPLPLAARLHPCACLLARFSRALPAPRCSYNAVNGVPACPNSHLLTEVARGELFSAKLSFYLDSLGPDTGALRVLPGSHRADHWVRAAAEPEGGPSLLNRSAERWGVEPQDVPGAVSLATEPGDAIM